MPSQSAITAARGPAADLAGDTDLPGKRILTDTGAELGTVHDVEFDPATGTVQYLLSADERIAGGRLIGVGPYAAIIRAV